MIRSFRHKGLKELFEKGSSRKIKQQDQSRCLRRLDALEAAEGPEQMNIPGFRFHELHTKPQRFSVWVTGNYRITFAWNGKDATDVNYEDYH